MRTCICAFVLAYQCVCLRECLRACVRVCKCAFVRESVCARGRAYIRICMYA